jgi:hypothetical protein
MSSLFEDQIVLYLDFLGFADASVQLDDDLQRQLLALLQGIASLRSEFEAKAEHREDGSSQYSVRPAVSTFSDHIVISYPFERIKTGDSSFGEIVVFHQIERYVSTIAAAALKIGFLIRGGVARGGLYHANGVVFGEAMVQAHRLESKAAIYPRIVVADELLAGKPEAKFAPWIRRDFDGLFCIDYFFNVILGAFLPGNEFSSNVNAWYRELVSQIKFTSAKLEASGKMTERAKWIWFARRLRETLVRQNPSMLSDMGISAADLDWA